MFLLEKGTFEVMRIRYVGRRAFLGVLCSILTTATTTITFSTVEDEPSVGSAAFNSKGSKVRFWIVDIG